MTNDSVSVFFLILSYFSAPILDFSWFFIVFVVLFVTAVATFFVAFRVTATWRFQVLSVKKEIYCKSFAIDPTENVTFRNNI